MFWIICDSEQVDGRLESYNLTLRIVILQDTQMNYLPGWCLEQTYYHSRLKSYLIYKIECREYVIHSFHEYLSNKTDNWQALLINIFACNCWLDDLSWTFEHLSICPWINFLFDLTFLFILVT